MAREQELEAIAKLSNPAEREVLNRFVSLMQGNDLRGREEAKTLAKTYIAGAADRLLHLDTDYTRDGLVHLVESYREQDRHVDALITEMFIMAKYSTSGPPPVIPSSELPDLRSAVDTHLPVIRQHLQLWARLPTREQATDLAKQFVQDHSGDLFVFNRYTLAEMVNLVESYRAAGRRRESVLANMWILANYEPQDIVGTFDLQGIYVSMAKQIVKAKSEGQAGVS